MPRSMCARNLSEVGLTLRELEFASLRTEVGQPVPGMVATAGKADIVTDETAGSHKNP